MAQLVTTPFPKGNPITQKETPAPRKETVISKENTTEGIPSLGNSQSGYLLQQELHGKTDENSGWLSSLTGFGKAMAYYPVFLAQDIASGVKTVVSDLYGVSQSFSYEGVKNTVIALPSQAYQYVNTINFSNAPEKISQITGPLQTFLSVVGYTSPYIMIPLAALSFSPVVKGAFVTRQSTDPMDQVWCNCTWTQPIQDKLLTNTTLNAFDRMRLTSEANAALTQMRELNGTLSTNGTDVTKLNDAIAYFEGVDPGTLSDYMLALFTRATNAVNVAWAWLAQQEGCKIDYSSFPMANNTELQSFYLPDFVPEGFYGQFQNQTCFPSAPNNGTTSGPTTEGPTTNGGPTSGTTSPGDISTPVSGDGGLSTGALAGIIVGSVIGTLVIAGGVAYLVVRQCRKPSSDEAERGVESGSHEMGEVNGIPSNLQAGVNEFIRQIKEAGNPTLIGQIVDEAPLSQWNGNKSVKEAIARYIIEKVGQEKSVAICKKFISTDVEKATNPNGVARQSNFADAFIRVYSGDILYPQLNFWLSDVAGKIIGFIQSGGKSIFFDKRKAETSEGYSEFKSQIDTMLTHTDTLIREIFGRKDVFPVEIREIARHYYDEALAKWHNEKQALTLAGGYLWLRLIQPYIGDLGKTTSEDKFDIGMTFLTMSQMILDMTTGGVAMQKSPYKKFIEQKSEQISQFMKELLGLEEKTLSLGTEKAPKRKTTISQTNKLPEEESASSDEEEKKREEYTHGYKIEGSIIKKESTKVTKTGENQDTENTEK